MIVCWCDLLSMSVLLTYLTINTVNIVWFRGFSWMFLKLHMQLAFYYPLSYCRSCIVLAQALWLHCGCFNVSRSRCKLTFRLHLHLSELHCALIIDVIILYLQLNIDLVVSWIMSQKTIIIFQRWSKCITSHPWFCIYAWYTW